MIPADPSAPSAPAAPAGAASSAAARTAAVVVNPSKFADLDAVRREVDAFAADHGWGPPAWFETDRDDSGARAAAAALATAPDLVCAMGGDGTVRAVAGALRGSGVPCGLLPSGTGNLLARNLGVPIDALQDALQVAFLGQSRPMDVGLATFDDGVERPFVVMGGVGLDGVIMGAADDRLKQRVGWGAYVVAGAPALLRGGFGARIAVDGEVRADRSCLMVLACNCSSVVGGIELATGADVHDGRLDLVMLRPNLLAGWVGVVIDLAARIRNGAASLQQWSGTRFDARLDAAVPAELDGDVVGETRTARFGVDAGALVVRLPVPAKRAPGLGRTDRDAAAGSPAAALEVPAAPAAPAAPAEDG